MNRALFFVHYNRRNALEPYVVYLVNQIRALYSRIVVISNSALPRSAEARLALPRGCVLRRENSGFDFGAWKDALLREGWASLAAYDSVTLMNDTCFGPLFPLEPLYGVMEARSADFWGMTNHRATPTGMPWTNGAIPEHIQSYFLCFSRRVVASQIFADFWNGVRNETHVWDAVTKYETQLTALLVNAGFTAASVLNDNDFPGGLIVHSYPQPELCITHRLPLVKLKTIVPNNDTWSLIRLVQETSDYPVPILTDYFFRHNFTAYCKGIVKRALPAPAWAALKKLWNAARKRGGNV